MYFLSIFFIKKEKKYRNNAFWIYVFYISTYKKDFLFLEM